MCARMCAHVHVFPLAAGSGVGQAPGHRGPLPLRRIFGGRWGIVVQKRAGSLIQENDIYANSRPGLPYPPPALFALRWLEPWQSGHGCCIWLLPFFSSISNQPTFEPLNQGTTHPFKGCRPPPSFSSSPAATSLSCIFVCKFFSISALRPRKQYGSGQCIPTIPPTIHKGSPKIGGFAPPFLCPFLKKNRDFCWESFPS